MMRDDSKAIFDDLLAEWHAYEKNDKLCPTKSVSPQFQGMRSSRQYDTTDEILDANNRRDKMKSIHFHVWEMQDPWRTAIHIVARNCYTGVKVWSSPRLPKDALACGEIVMEARTQLLRRLVFAGVV